MTPNTAPAAALPAARERLVLWLLALIQFTGSVHVVAKSRRPSPEGRLSAEGRARSRTP